jgi:hypothetical protein
MRCTTKCFNQRERHQCPNQNGPLRRALNCAHRAILWARRSAGWDEPSLNCGGPSPPLNGRPAARNAASPSLSYNRKEPWVAQAAFSPCKRTGSLSMSDAGQRNLRSRIADRATHVASFREIATSPSRVSRQGKVSILALRDSGIARLDYLFLEPAGAM